MGHDGAALGVFLTSEAIQRAKNQGMDLVEIAPQARPPVCKILDYGKFKYEAQKKKSAAKKNQKTFDVKEIKVRPAIGSHDYEIKMNRAKKFLESGDKVKFSLMFRGREMAHQELGQQLMQRIKDDFAELVKVEHEPKQEGRQIIMVVAPKAT